MPRKTKTAVSVAVQPSKGKKTVFGDDESIDIEFDELANRGEVPGIDAEQEDDDDDDEAPEAVGLNLGRAAEENQWQKVQSSEMAKRQAERLRSQKIQAMKDALAKLKGKGKATPKQPAAPRRSTRLSAPITDQDDAEDGGEDDAETRRLRARMERAMDDGSGDSEDEDEDAVSDNDLDEDEGDDGSFHTESEGDEASFHTEDEDEEGGANEDIEEEEDGDESDDSETLKEGPLTAQDIKMRALMDKAMAAADKRAGLDLAKSARGSGAVSPASTETTKGKGKVTEAEGRDLTNARPVALEDETMWDMAPGFGPKPLSSAMLAAAEATEQGARAKKQRQKQAAVERREAEDRAQRKKRRKVKQADEVTRRLEDGRTIQLLPPRLEQSSALPPAIDPVRKDQMKNSKDKFLKVAMKYSGQRPGRGVVDGRKKIGMRTM